MRTRLCSLFLSISLVFFGALGVGVLTPKEAYAQGIPTTDPKNDPWWGNQLAQRLIEAYKLAREWRDVALDKARALYQQTLKLSAIRRQLESRAIGELGRLGEYVPDWRDYANYCAIDVRGITICNLDSYIFRKFEDVLHNIYFRWQGDLLARISNLQHDVDQLFGAAYYRFLGRHIDEFRGTSDESAIHVRSAVTASAHQSIALERAAEHLNIVLDSIMVAEIQDKEISSTRAQQLAAHLAYIEAIVELEIARASADILATQALANAEKIKDARRRRFVLSYSAPQ